VILSFTGAGISEHGIFHGIIDLQKNMLLKIKEKRLIYNRVGVVGTGR
jgi:hypothetical protein